MLSTAKFKQIIGPTVNKDVYHCRHGFNVAAYNASMQELAANNSPTNAGGSEDRSEISEEHLWRHGGPTFKNVQPKSYKILEQQLPQSAVGGKSLAFLCETRSEKKC